MSKKSKEVTLYVCKKCNLILMRLAVIKEHYTVTVFDDDGYSSTRFDNYGYSSTKQSKYLNSVRNQVTSQAWYSIQKNEETPDIVPAGYGCLYCNERYYLNTKHPEKEGLQPITLPVKLAKELQIYWRYDIDNYYGIPFNNKVKDYITEQLL